jgi:hypothetical protein
MPDGLLTVMEHDISGPIRLAENGLGIEIRLERMTPDGT